MRAALNDKYVFAVIEDKHMIWLPVSHGGVKFMVIISPDERQEQYSIFMTYDRKVPVNQREEMAVLMCRANQQIVCGGFEMDPSDGECRFRHLIDVEGVTTTVTFLQDFVDVHIATGARCWPALEAVMNGGKAQAALSRIE
jgi:hypothetical protein